MSKSVTRGIARKSDTLEELIAYIDGCGPTDLAADTLAEIFKIVKSNVVQCSLSLPTVGPGQALPDFPLPRYVMQFHVWESRPLWREVSCGFFFSGDF